jgi:hypothetical protein
LDFRRESANFVATIIIKGRSQPCRVSLCVFWLDVIIGYSGNGGNVAHARRLHIIPDVLPMLTSHCDFRAQGDNKYRGTPRRA